ncbi:MAG: flagellar motor protein MotB [Desulfobulbaceae bacterium]|nr:MAG: flagellar motor protein MotB [Desulfobulbaceae bacterium]
MAEENEKQQEEEKKEKKCDCSGGAPAWMVTYSDLVTLLLTFFVLLMSMANLDPVRFTEASSSLKDAFGIHSRPAHVEFAIPILPAPPKTKFTPVQPQMTKKIYQRVKAQIDDLDLGQTVDAINQDSETIILRVNNTVLFKPGESRVSPQAYPVLRKIADMVRPLPMNMRVEGHTDNQAISGPAGYNNWDLSIARAVSVTRFYEQGELLPLDRMSAIGYGDQRPLVLNTTEENRSKNRRVDFVLRVKSSIGTGSASNGSNRIPL